MKFQKLNLNEFDQQGFHLDVQTTLPPLVSWLPVLFTIRNPTFYVGNDPVNQMVGIKTPDLIFKLSDPLPFDAGVNITFLATQELNKVLKELMTLPQEATKQNLLISANIDVELFGTVCK
jgi:hypothetical protein